MIAQSAEVAGPPTGRTGKLLEIEGLRAYLALWVVVGHVLWAAGLERDGLTGISLLLRTPELAVDLFIMVSGFVIFLALDTKGEGYLQFVTGRFFRLFPVFIVLFLISIPISTVTMWNATHAAHYLAPADVNYAQMLTWWDNIGWHIPLHLTMLHGAVPEAILPGSPGAFLIPAWSVSLEWQFYLIAPIAFAWAKSPSWLAKVALLATWAGLLFVDPAEIPWVAYGAALPFHAHYFFVGCASYFLYERRAMVSRPGVWFGLGCVGAVSIFVLRQAIPWSVVPMILWLAFLGLILERPTTVAHRIVSPVFSNRVALFLGKISYSVYLSHMLVISLVQFVLLSAAPELPQRGHLAILLVATLAVTLPLSIVLHRRVEVAGIAFGKKLASSMRWTARDAANRERSGYRIPAREIP